MLKFRLVFRSGTRAVSVVLDTSYRNKIFIGTSRKNHCNHKDNAVKSSDKNISVQENWMEGKISDLEKVPIKIGTIIIVRYAIGSRDIPDYYMRRTTYCDNKRKSTS